jgi:D-alanyl-lipoteichoic acid acyltransferase DltB (MBOAT superfamily)
MLLYFKYFGFFVDNVVAAFARIGFDIHLGTLEILLPAGISFYTFQTMSYTIDVYRGELRPRTSLLDYVAFVSFFPQLVAGPIERASSLLPQLEVARRFSWENLRSGFGLALWGAFKKLVIADTLAPYIDKVFVHHDPVGPLVWAASTGFMIQLYADFSGYTDLARGISRMLGVHLVKNFDEPYLATTTPEFWQRWHMSLSAWIRDYLLTPLLGDSANVTPLRFACAVTVTMVIMGAWHGAGWNYVAFGLFHAGCILGYVAAVRALPAWAASIPYGRVLARLFHVFVIGEIGSLLFRSPSLARFYAHVSRIPYWASDDEWRAAAAILTLTGALSLPFLVEHVARRQVMPRLEGSPWRLPVQTTVWSVFVLAIGISYRSTGYDFIYFQF